MRQENQSRHTILLPFMLWTKLLIALWTYLVRSRIILYHVTFSDNGKTFKAAAKVIDAVVRSEDVQRHFAGVGVTWLFNIEIAPWWGGMLERLIRYTKHCLKKVIGKSKLDYDELTRVERTAFSASCCGLTRYLIENRANFTRFTPQKLSICASTRGCTRSDQLSR